MMLAEPRHEPKVRQGVTTEVIGVDGNSYAPFATQEDLDDFVTSTPASMAPRDDPSRLGTVATTSTGSTAGQPQRRLLDRQLAAADRSRRLGRRRRPTPRRAGPQAASSARACRKAPSGCHRASTTRRGATPRPGARRAARGGRRATAASTTPMSATRSATASSTRSARRSRSGGAAGRPAHITHFYHRKTFPGSPDQMLGLVDDARAGLDVTFDAYPAEWASTRLLIHVPTWVQAGGPVKTKERLAEQSVRNRIRRELQERGTLFAGAGGLRDVRIGYLHGQELLPWEGRSLGELIDQTGSDPVDTLCDLLLAEDLRPNEVTPGPHIDGIRRS